MREPRGDRAQPGALEGGGHLLRCQRRRDIDIADGPAGQQVPHGAADDARARQRRQYRPGAGEAKERCRVDTGQRGLRNGIMWRFPLTEILAIGHVRRRSEAGGWRLTPIREGSHLHWRQLSIIVSVALSSRAAL